MDDTSDIDDFDVSWIQEQERINSSKLIQKREPMQEIKLCFIYINQNKYIQDIKYDVEVIDESSILLNRLLHIIQNRKLRTSTSKFKLIDVLSYNVDLEPESLQAFAQSDSFHLSFLKPVSITNDIKIPESIFFFHKINTLYFIFQEVGVKQSNLKHTMKSILKPTSSSSSPVSSGSTKKVRISMANHTTRKTTDRNT